MCGHFFVIAVLASLAVPSVAVETVAVDASAQFPQSSVRTKVDEAASAVNAAAVDIGKEALVVEPGKRKDSLSLSLSKQEVADENDEEGVALVAVDASAQFKQSMVRKKVVEAARVVTAANAVNAGAAETGNEALVVEAGKEESEGEAQKEEVADAEEDEEEEDEEEGEEDDEDEDVALVEEEGGDGDWEETDRPPWSAPKGTCTPAHHRCCQPGRCDMGRRVSDGCVTKGRGQVKAGKKRMGCKQAKNKGYCAHSRRRKIGQKMREHCWATCTYPYC